ncbi:MAG: PilN domain-containing protein [Pseudomonadota bacterium]
MTQSTLRQRLAPWMAWWRSGMGEAWARLPKPSALKPRPRIFQHSDGLLRAYAEGRWAAVAPASGPIVGRLLNPDDVLLRQIRLPALEPAELRNAIELEARGASPFPWADTLHGYNVRHAPDGLLDIEIALSRRATEDTVDYPLLHAMGSLGPIAMGDTTNSQAPETWYRDRITLALLGLLLLLALLAALTPTLLMRAEVRAGNVALERIAAATAPLVAQRDELTRIQQSLEQIQAYAQIHPIPLQLIEHITQAMPDGNWLTQMGLKSGQLTLDGYANDSGAIVAALEKIPGLRDVRLGSGVTRDPRNGKEIFRIEAQLSEPPAP